MNIIYALLFTVVIEGIVMLLLTRSGRWVYCSILCNLVTNPVINLVLMLIRRSSGSDALYLTATAVGEVLVLIAEAHLYRFMTGAARRRCYLLSAVTNLVSFTAGLVLNMLLHS